MATLESALDEGVLMEDVLCDRAVPARVCALVFPR